MSKTTSRAKPSKTALSVRLATFNVENLMARFDFSSWRDARKRDRSANSSTNAHLLEQARMIAYEDDARQMTALAIADCRADIICLQEVENIETLEAFEKNYLESMTGLSYPHKVLIEGNDTRGIDVALMARRTTSDGKPIEIRKVKSHSSGTFEQLGVYSKELAARRVSKKDRVFKRDCLEVDLKIGGKPVTIFVAHLKSMGTSKESVSGREYTMPVRAAEAQAIRNIITRKFGEERAGDMRWLVCGDLNDYSERLAIEGNKYDGYSFELHQENENGAAPLLANGFSEDLVKRRASNNRWTLHYANGPVHDSRDPEKREVRQLVQLDYILASPAMAQHNMDAVPEIIRNGQPHRTIFPPEQEVERYPRTGWDRPKASDHCPVAVMLKIV